MKLDNITFSTETNGYSKKEVDRFIDSLMRDYRKFDDKIVIGKGFSGTINPDTFIYKGTMKQWEDLKKWRLFDDIPCIICEDGDVVQRI